MNVYVYNKSLNLQGVVDDYKSIIWTTRYFKAGDFELYLRASEKNINLLQKDFYLCREQDINGTELHNVMIIQNIELTTDVEQGNFLIVTGKCLKSIVGRRIILQQTSLTGRVEIAIRKIIGENIIAPTISARKIDNFILSEVKGFTETMSSQVTGDNIEEWLETVCTAYGMGWDVFVQKKAFVFYLWKGENRSYDQDVNPYVVFSKEFDNLLTSDYKFSAENYKNVAVIAGEGEGLNRKTYVVGVASGLQRYELYVDARDVSTNDGEVTTAEYNKLLIEQGLEALAETATTESFSGSVAPNRNYVLNEDYFLGDVVQVINEYGISATPRIIEIIDSEDDTGRTVIPTFSTMEV